MKKNNMEHVTSALSKLTDDELMSIQLSMPWQQDAVSENPEKDADGFFTVGVDTVDTPEMREKLQRVCWNKFNQNPFVGTAVRGQVGRLTGLGFDISSEIAEIQEAVQETELDPRNRLYSYWTKYVGRSIIEGELFLLLTVHDNSFIEDEERDDRQAKPSTSF